MGGVTLSELGLCQTFHRLFFWHVWPCLTHNSQRRLVDSTNMSSLFGPATPCANAWIYADKDFNQTLKLESMSISRHVGNWTYSAVSIGFQLFLRLLNVVVHHMFGMAGCFTERLPAMFSVVSFDSLIRSSYSMLFPSLLSGRHTHKIKFVMSFCVLNCNLGCYCDMYRSIQSFASICFFPAAFFFQLSIRPPRLKQGSRPPVTALRWSSCWPTSSRRMRRISGCQSASLHPTRAKRPGWEHHLVAVGWWLLVCLLVVSFKHTFQEKIAMKWNEDILKPLWKWLRCLNFSKGHQTWANNSVCFVIYQLALFLGDHQLDIWCNWGKAHQGTHQRTKSHSHFDEVWQDGTQKNGEDRLYTPDDSIFWLAKNNKKQSKTLKAC